MSVQDAIKYMVQAYTQSIKMYGEWIAYESAAMLREAELFDKVEKSGYKFSAYGSAGTYTASASRTSVTINIYLGKEQEFGDVNDILDYFIEDKWTASEMVQDAESKRRTLTYHRMLTEEEKRDIDVTYVDQMRVTINVYGKYSDKCIVHIDEHIEQLEEPITQRTVKTTRLICAGDPEYAEIIRKQQEEKETQHVPVNVVDGSRSVDDEPTSLDYDADEIPY